MLIGLVNDGFRTGLEDRGQAGWETEWVGPKEFEGEGEMLV